MCLLKKMQEVHSQFSLFPIVGIYVKLNLKASVS